MKNRILIFAVLLLVIGCRKNETTVVVNETPDDPIILDGYEPTTQSVTASVFGLIIDENKQPVPGAQVSMGALSTTSDAFGSFKFENETMNQMGTFVKIEKTDFFDSGRRFYPLDGSFSNLTIELIKLDYETTFESSVASIVSIKGDGGTIEFEANSMALEDGTLYDGIVEVSTRWLSPTAFETINQMPGALQGVNLENEEIGLTTYGMLAAEFRSSAGLKLNIMEGKTATIKLNVPNELLGSAPQEIPLWSFNYEYGIWVEESSATLIDGQYVGQVSHFSFWNCDAPENLVFMDLKTVDDVVGDPIQGSIVVFTTMTGAISSGTGVTGINGVAAGFIPKDVDLMLEIISPCGDMIYSEAIGSFSEDVSLGEYEIGGSVSIRGKIVGCENELVEEPILLVNSGDRTLEYNLIGNPFITRVLVCSSSSTIDVAGGDLATFEQGTYITTDVVSAIDVGELAACGEELIGYFKITVDGTTTRYFNLNKTAQAPSNATPYVTQMFSSNDNNNTMPGDTLHLSYGIASGGTGFANYAADWSATDFIDVLIDTENGWLFSDGNGLETFIITEYGPTPGTIYRGYGSGTLTNIYGGGSGQVFVECEFADYWE